jgi:Tfp pilus assembly protein PilV
MKDQPAVLALIISNFALLAFIFYALQSSAASRNQLVGQVLTNSNAIHTLLQQRSVACPDVTAPPT